MEFQEKKTKILLNSLKSYIKDYVHKIKFDVIVDCVYLGLIFQKMVFHSSTC